MLKNPIFEDGLHLSSSCFVPSTALVWAAQQALQAPRPRGAQGPGRAGRGYGGGVQDAVTYKIRDYKR